MQNILNLTNLMRKRKWEKSMIIQNIPWIFACKNKNEKYTNQWMQIISNETVNIEIRKDKCFGHLLFIRSWHNLHIADITNLCNFWHCEQDYYMQLLTKNIPEHKYLVFSQQEHVPMIDLSSKNYLFFM